MGDFNIPDKDLSWVRSEASDLVPLVHGHRNGTQMKATVWDTRLLYFVI